MNINECGCRPYGWLGLDGNRCIRVIPRQSRHPPGSRHNLGPDTPQDQTPPGTRHPPPSRQPPGAEIPPRDSHCCRQYASYWNVFLYFIESVDILFVFSFDVRVIFTLKRKAVAKRRFCLFSDIQYVVKLWSLTFILSITVHVILTSPSLNVALKWNRVCLVKEQS